MDISISATPGGFGRLGEGVLVKLGEGVFVDKDVLDDPMIGDHCKGLGCTKRGGGGGKLLVTNGLGG